MATKRDRGRPAPWLILTGVLALGLVLMVAATMVRNTLFTPAPASPSPAPGTSSAPPATLAPPPPGGLVLGGCGAVREGDFTPLRSAPEAQWSLVAGGVAVPTTTAGPASVEGNIRKCYEHSSTGAVVAATNLSVGAWKFREVVEQQVTSGPLRDEVLASWDRRSSGTTSLQLAGFLQTQSSPEASTVLVVYRVEGSRFLVMPMQLAWSDGDWKIDGSGNTPTQQPYQVKDLTGYVPWSGVK